MGHEVLKKFDRYFLLDCIAQGGMAEIFRARPAVLEASGRYLIIKRILGGYGRNADFRRMFKSEIKVMLGFNHPNIVQLYDFGDVKGQPYIAMEWVDGKNLRQFISRTSKKNEKMPIEMGCFVVEQAAAGLHYAHAFKNKITGEALNIVHRDVSPQNILVSFDGNVKVIDFGIAKARTNVDSTRVGIIKGKPSYLSPEQISGEVLDGRSDIFSLGAVLWETLTGRKLFAAVKGENEFAVLKLIESCDSYVKPPSALNPTVPRELDDIVMKALVKNRKKRYQTAGEFQKALRKFLFSYNPDFAATEMSEYGKKLFKDEIVEDRKVLQHLNTKVESLLDSDFFASPTGSRSIVHLESGTKNIEEEAVEIKKEEKSEKGSKKDDKKTTHTFIDPRSSVKEKGDNNLAKLDPNDIKSEGIILDKNAEASQKQTKKKKQEAKKLLTRSSGIDKPYRTSKIQLKSKAPKQDVQHSSGSGGGLGIMVASVAVAIASTLYFGPRYIDPWPPWKTKKVIPQPNPNPTNRTPDSGNDLPPRQVEKIRLRLDITPATNVNQTEILVNNNRYDPANPVGEVPLDTPIVIEVRRPGFRGVRMDHTLDSRLFGGKQLVEKRVELEKIRYGYLTIVTTPPNATAIFRAVDRGPAADGSFRLQTPIENQKIPIGVYNIKLENDLLGMEKTVTVEVEEEKTKRVIESLDLR